MDSKRMDLGQVQEVHTSVIDPTQYDESPSPLKIRQSKIYAEDLSNTLYLSSSPKKKHKRPNTLATKPSIAIKNIS